MRECRVMTAEGNGVSFRDDGLTATIAAHICKHTNFHWIVHFTNALGWTVCHTMNYTLICWSVQSLSRVWLCDPMNRSMPGLPVHHQLPKSTQTHVHRVGDAILILCRPLFLLPSIFPSIRVFSNESALCIRWPNIGVSASTSVLPMNTQDWSPLGWTGWISLQSKGLSRVFSRTTVQKYQFLSAQLSL